MTLSTGDFVTWVSPDNGHPEPRLGVLLGRERHDQGPWGVAFIEPFSYPGCDPSTDNPEVWRTLGIEPWRNPSAWWIDRDDLTDVTIRPDGQRIEGQVWARTLVPSQRPWLAENLRPCCSHDWTDEGSGGIVHRAAPAGSIVLYTEADVEREVERRKADLLERMARLNLPGALSGQTNEADALEWLSAMGLDILSETRWRCSVSVSGVMSFDAVLPSYSVDSSEINTGIEGEWRHLVMVYVDAIDEDAAREMVDMDLIDDALRDANDFDLSEFSDWCPEDYYVDEVEQA